MASARREMVGEIVAWHVAQVHSFLSGEKLDPRRINPYRVADPEVEKAIAEVEKKDFWDRMQFGLFGGKVW